MPLPQVVVPKSLSIIPSQSLSLLSHFSSVGFTPPVQELHFPSAPQVCVPYSHSPTLLPQVIASPILQLQFSSISPSQSLSSLSHNSVVGVPGTALHFTSNLSWVQTKNPDAWQAPSPTTHPCPRYWKSSSISMSQSLSKPSQSSVGLGVTSPLHVELQAPLEQYLVPLLHTPTPAVPVGPV